MIEWHSRIKAGEKSAKVNLPRHGEGKHLASPVDRNNRVSNSGFTDGPAITIIIS